MPFELPPLPYAKNALEPHLSAETLEYHHGKHHRAYVNKLNELVEGTEHEKKSLEDIVKSSSGDLFNQAAQAWNHGFYWYCLSPDGGGEPDGALGEAIRKKFGSFSKFKKDFNEKAAGNFASGWTWLVRTTDGGVEIVNTDDADTPIAHGGTPLLTVDVWEHAYYIDYRNARPKYLENIWNVIDWDFVEKNFG